MARRAFHHCLRGRPAESGQQLALHRAGVDPHADRDFPLIAGVCHCADPVGSADVAGIDADLVGSRRDRLKGEAVVKVDVGHHRHPRMFLESGDKRHCLPVRNSRSDNPAARRLERRRLPKISVDVVGWDAEHRLNCHRRASADGDAAHQNLFCPSHILPPGIFQEKYYNLKRSVEGRAGNPVRPAMATRISGRCRSKSHRASGRSSVRR